MTKSFITRLQINSRVMKRARQAQQRNMQEFALVVASDIEDEYRKNAPRDTSAMAESVYVQAKNDVFHRGKKSSLAAVTSVAKARNERAEISPSPKPTNETTFYIKPVVKYFMYNEFGTSRMAARPTMALARKTVQGRIDRKFRKQARKVITDGQ